MCNNDVFVLFPVLKFMGKGENESDADLIYD